MEECLEILDALDCNHKELICQGLEAVKSLIRLSVLKDTKEAAEFFGVGTVDIDDVTVCKEVLSMVPREVAERYCIAPVRVSEGTLYIAMAIIDVDTMDAISYITKLPVKTLLCSADSLGRAIARLYYS
jgi:hypothetical protein